MLVLDLAQWQHFEMQSAQPNGLQHFFESSPLTRQERQIKEETVVNWLAFWFFPQHGAIHDRQHQKLEVLQRIHGFFTRLLETSNAFANACDGSQEEIAQQQRLVLEMALLLSILRGLEPQVSQLLRKDPLQQILEQINRANTLFSCSSDPIRQVTTVQAIWTATCDVLLLLLSDISFAFDVKNLPSEAQPVMITNTQLKTPAESISKVLVFVSTAMRDTLLAVGAGAIPEQESLARHYVAWRLLHQTPSLITSIRKYFHDHQGDLEAKDVLRRHIVQLVTNGAGSAKESIASELELAQMFMLLISTLDHRDAFADHQVLTTMKKCIDNQTRIVLDRANSIKLFDSLVGLVLGVGVFVSHDVLQASNPWWRAMLVQYAMVYQHILLPFEIESVGVTESDQIAQQLTPPLWHQQLAHLQSILRSTLVKANGIEARNAACSDCTTMKEIQDRSLMLLELAVQRLRHGLIGSRSSYAGVMMAFQQVFLSPESFTTSTTEFLTKESSKDTDRRWPIQHVCRFFCRAYLIVTCSLDALLVSTTRLLHQDRQPSEPSVPLLHAYRIVMELEFCKPLVLEPPGKFEWLASTFWSRMELEWRRDSLHLLQLFEAHHTRHFCANVTSYFGIVFARALQHHQTCTSRDDAESTSLRQVPRQHNYLWASELLAYGLLIQRNVRAVLFSSELAKTPRAQQQALWNFETTLDLVFQALFNGFQPLDAFAQRFVTFLMAFLPRMSTNHSEIHERRLVPGLIESVIMHFPGNCSQQCFTKVLGSVCGALFAYSDASTMQYEECQGLMLWTVQRFAEHSTNLLELENAEQSSRQEADGLFVLQMLCEMLKIMPFTGIVPCSAVQLERVIDQVSDPSKRARVLQQIEKVLFQHCERSRRAWFAAWWIDVMNKYSSSTPALEDQRLEPQQPRLPSKL